MESKQLCQGVIVEIGKLFMKKFFQYITKHVMRFMNYVMNDHLGAYATSSAYFLILSFIPFILLLMTSIQFTPLTKGFVSDVILSVTPNGFHSAAHRHH